MSRWMRVWHKWTGLVGVLMLTVFASTGLYLNHKEFWNEKLGLEARPPRAQKDGPKFNITARNVLSAPPVSFEAALQTVEKRWGEVELSSAGLSNARGELAWKFETAKPRRSLWVSAQTGAVTRETGADGVNVPRLIQDIHHLNFGLPAQLLADFFAVSLLLLNFTGLWMGLRNELAIRRSRKSRSAAQKLSHLT